MKEILIHLCPAKDPENCAGAWKIGNKNANDLINNNSYNVPCRSGYTLGRVFKIMSVGKDMRSERYLFYQKEVKTELTLRILKAINKNHYTLNKYNQKSQIKKIKI